MTFDTCMPCGRTGVRVRQAQVGAPAPVIRSLRLSSHSATLVCIEPTHECECLEASHEGRRSNGETRECACINCVHFVCSA